VNSIKKTARVAGFLYLLLAVAGPVRIMYIPSKLFVHGPTTRRKGITITTYDLFIATMAEQNQSILLHADKHFDQIASNQPSLQVESYVKALSKKSAF
jgi:hypothetical protein